MHLSCMIGKLSKITYSVISGDIKPHDVIYQYVDMLEEELEYQKLVCSDMSVNRSKEKGII